VSSRVLKCGLIKAVVYVHLFQLWFMQWYTISYIWTQFSLSEHKAGNFLYSCDIFQCRKDLYAFVSYLIVTKFYILYLLTYNTVQLRWIWCVCSINILSKKSLAHCLSYLINNLFHWLSGDYKQTKLVWRSAVRIRPRTEPYCSNIWLFTLFYNLNAINYGHFCAVCYGVRFYSF